MKQDRKLIEELRISKPANANLAHYMSKICDFPVHGNTKVTYFPLGEDKFVELKIQLENAKKFIFMEYFIVETGAMWNAILDILKRKVDEGVEVRFMYDGMCSISLLPYRYPKKLEKMGIKCKMFNPIKPVLSIRKNGN